MLWRATRRDMASDRRRVAGNSAARGSEFAIRSDLGNQAPIMRRYGYPAAQEIVGALLDGGIIRTGLEQQDAAVGVLAQAGGQNGAGGSGATDNVVVLHRSIPPIETCVAFIWPCRTDPY